MQYNTKEMLLVLRPDNILAINIHEGCNELTMEGTEEVIAGIEEAFKVNDQPKALLFWTAHFYVKKEILKRYAVSEFNEAAVALVCRSYIAKFVGSIALKMRNRFIDSNVSDQKAPVKIFMDEDKAFKWLQSVLAKQKESA